MTTILIHRGLGLSPLPTIHSRDTVWELASVKSIYFMPLSFSSLWFQKYSILSGPFAVIVAYTVYNTLVGQPMAGLRTTSYVTLVIPYLGLSWLETTTST